MRQMLVLASALACLFCNAVTAEENKSPPPKSAARVANPARGAESRAAYRVLMENRLLAMGFDAYVTVTGPQNEQLNLQWTFFTRPTVYQLLNQSDFVKSILAEGFERLSIDGSGGVWRYRRSGATFTQVEKF